MTERPGNAAVQAPGIGGPVDLAGIARYRKLLAGVTVPIWIAVLAAVVANSHLRLEWPGESPLHQGPGVTALVLQAGVWAHITLAFTSAGNKTEARLAGLGAVWAAAIGVVMAIGSGALLAWWAPGWPHVVRLMAAILAGYAAIIPPLLVVWRLTNRRFKRLEAAEEAA